MGTFLTRLDTSYPEMLLVALAQCQRACQGVMRSRTSRQEHASRCVEQQRSVGFGEDGQSANGLVEQSAVPLWLSNAIEPCDCIRVAAFNRRMRENRTSGGVGGWPGRKSRPLDPIKLTKACRRCYCTAIVAVFDFRFAVVTITGTAFPDATPAGKATFTWYRPTNPGDKPANRKGAVWPPIVTLTPACTLDKLVPPPATAPLAGVLVTAPRPEQKIVRTSPVMAGRDVAQIGRASGR